MFRLDGKVALLFGGFGYLGRHFCRALLEYGATLYACDKVSGEMDVADEDRKRFFPVRCDVSRKSELDALRRKIEKEQGRLDVLINCLTAKGDDFYLPFEEVSEEGWNIGLHGNLTLPFLTCREFIPMMKTRRSGSIINISSIYGIVGNDQRIYEGSNLHEVYLQKSPDIQRIYSHGVYNAAKGGLNAFTRYLAAYYGEFNIRVNTLTPGGLHYDQENETFRNKYGGRTPLGRKGRPEEMAGALIFLASDASTYVTGHNLVVDGGYTIW